MWRTTQVDLSGGRGKRLRFFEGDRPLSVTEVTTLWQRSTDFSEVFSAELLRSGYDALFWETPAAQRRALWSHVGAALEARLGETPLWLSTAGMGVPWLHVRIVRRPKYYRHAAYRTP